MSKIVYVDGNENEYTREDILAEIADFLVRNQSFADLDRARTTQILYKYVLSLAEYQHPGTILDEISNGPVAYDERGLQTTEEVAVLRERILGI